MTPPPRYHPFLVFLHWLLAVLIVGGLAGGWLLLARTLNTDPAKVGILRLHMAGGMLVMALTVLRAVVLLATARPAPARTGYLGLDLLGQITHAGFYVVILLLVATGFATGVAAGLPDIVFASSGEALPPDLRIFPTWRAHFWLGLLLTGLVWLHVLAALYHQFIRGDRLLARVWFGKQQAAP